MQAANKGKDFGGVLIEGAFAMALLIMSIFTVLDLSSLLSEQRIFSKLLHNSHLDLLLSIKNNSLCVNQSVYKSSFENVYTIADDNSLTILEDYIREHLEKNVVTLGLSTNKDDFYYEVSFYNDEETNQKYALIGVKAKKNTKIFGFELFKNCQTLLTPITLFEEIYPTTPDETETCSLANLVSWNDLKLDKAVEVSENFCSK